MDNDGSGNIERRDFLTRAAAAGAITWAAPVILSRSAFAVDAGSPSCTSISVSCAAPVFCDGPGAGNDRTYPSFVISASCSCGPLDWCFSFVSAQGEVGVFTVAGACPVTELAENTAYCATGPVALVVAQGSGVEVNDYSVAVTVQGTCNGVPFCQTVTISGDGSVAPPTCTASLPAACTSTGCTGCTPLP